MPPGLHPQRHKYASATLAHNGTVVSAVLTDTSIIDAAVALHVSVTQ